MVANTITIIMKLALGNTELKHCSGKCGTESLRCRRERDQLNVIASNVLIILLCMDTGVMDFRMVNTTLDYPFVVIDTG